MFVFSIIMISVVLPLYMFYWLGNGKTVNKSQLIVKTIASGFVIYTLFLFNNWAFTSFYLRYIYLVIYLLTVIFAWWQAWEQPLRGSLDIRQWAPVFGGIILIAVCSLILASIAGADELPIEPQAVEIEFPLERGVYYAAQAGNSQAMNGHMAVIDQPVYRGQTWGLDILKLNILGSRASGIYPGDPASYYIYGTPVYAPCDGGITASENDLPDLNPPEKDDQNLAGNFVKIECEEGFFLILAHFQQGSLMVAEGDIVSTGSRIGVVGNSGNTSEPHLHIHAQVEEGEEHILDSDPLPIIFRNHGWLVRNDLIRRYR